MQNTLLPDKNRGKNRFGGNAKNFKSKQNDAELRLN